MGIFKSFQKYQTKIGLDDSARWNVRDHQSYQQIITMGNCVYEIQGNDASFISLQNDTLTFCYIQSCTKVYCMTLPFPMAKIHLRLWLRRRCGSFTVMGFACSVSSSSSPQFPWKRHWTFHWRTKALQGKNKQKKNCCCKLAINRRSFWLIWTRYEPRRCPNNAGWESPCFNI